MLFKKEEAIHIVGGCPVTRASSGVMEFPPPLIAKIAGAVTDKIEWMVLLLGERSEDGFTVKVTDFRIPQQRRTTGDVSMAEPMEGDGSTIDDSVVGVLHSHHSMGAFFSHTDNTELNPFFKSSIVVAQGAKSALGFAYKAEGKVVLPCGSVGKIPFVLAISGSERWNAKPVRGSDPNGTLGDCDRITVTEEETDIETVATHTTACKLEAFDRKEKPLVYGQEGGSELLAEIRTATVSYGFRNGHQGNTFGNRGYTSTQDAHLSRRARKELARQAQGKASARREGIFSAGSSDRCEVGDDDDGLFAKPPHKSAKNVMVNGQRVCAFEEENSKHPCDSTMLYLYFAPLSGWSDWLCADCYDFASDPKIGAGRSEERDTALDTDIIGEGDTHPFVVGNKGINCMAAVGRNCCMQLRFSHCHVGLPICLFTKEEVAECKCTSHAQLSNPDPAAVKRTTCPDTGLSTAICHCASEHCNGSGEKTEATEPIDLGEFKACRRLGHVPRVVRGVVTCITCAGREGSSARMTEQEARAKMVERLGVAGLLAPAGGTVH